MACALIVGTALGISAYYSWELHDQVARLNSQVAHLTATVCYYQALTAELNVRLAREGFPQVVLPEPQPCPASAP